MAPIVAWGPLAPAGAPVGAHSGATGFTGDGFRAHGALLRLSFVASGFGRGRLESGHRGTITIDRPAISCRGGPIRRSAPWARGLRRLGRSRPSARVQVLPGAGDGLWGGLHRRLRSREVELGGWAAGLGAGGG